MTLDYAYLSRLNLEASLRRHFQNAIYPDLQLKFLSIYNNTRIMTLDEYDRDIGNAIGDWYLIVFDIGVSNPFRPKPDKVDRVVSFEIHFVPQNDRGHLILADHLQKKFQPNTTLQFWDVVNDVSDWTAWTLATGGLYILDVTDGRTYQGNTGRMVMPFAMHLKYRRFAN